MNARTAARLNRVIAAPLAAFAFFALALVGAPAALAAPPHYAFSFGTFPAEEPHALTVDQSNGDIYAIDQTDGTVRRYDSNGSPKNFTAGPDAGTNTLTGFGFFGDQVAVDSSGTATDGDIYVASFNGIDVYSNEGAHLGTLTGANTPPAAFTSACGVAVDQSNGDLYVADLGDIAHGNVWRYSPSSGPVADSNYSGGIETEAIPCNIGVSQGTVFSGSTSPFFGDGSVRAYPTSAFATGTPPSPAGTAIVASGATTVDADPTSGNVYVDKGNHIEVFEASGASVYEFGTSADFSESAGVALDSQSGKVYVSDPANTPNGQIDVFAPAGASIPPSATTNPATAISHRAATLNGHLTLGSDASITDCHFDWGTTVAYSGGTVPCDQATPITGTANVTAPLTGLTPGQTYHFRLSITGSSSGQILGGDQSFATSPYNLTTNPATAISHTVATLNGHLDPDGDPTLNVTECHFDWGTTTAYSGGTVPCAQGNSFSAASNVSALLTGLHPGSTYHFRLHITTASVGEFTGSDQSFAATAFPVSTDAATNLHHTDVVLNGHFDPQGDSALNVTDCHFDWGTSTSYGNTVPCAQGNSFSAPASVSAFINNLTPGTVYHFSLDLTTAGAGQFSGPDQAVTPPIFSIVAPPVVAFGEDGTSASIFGGSAGYYQSEATLGFDQADRRVYVAGGTALGGFDASDPDSGVLPPLSGFNPYSFPHGLQGAGAGVAIGAGGDVFVASADQAAAVVYGIGPSGSDLGGSFPIDPTVDPGAPSGGPNVRLAGIAVDSSGHIWVSNNRTKYIIEYDSAGNFLAAHDISAQGYPQQLAFDSNDDLLVRLGNLQGGGVDGIWRFTHASGYTAASQVIPAGGGNIRGFTVDPSTGDIYIAKAFPAQVDQYDSAGNFIGTFGAGTSGLNYSGITVDAANHYVYVANFADTQKVLVFPPGKTDKGPTVTTQAPTAIAGHSVTLNAKVDPENFAVTDCHFDWIDEAGYDANAQNPYAAGDTAPCTPDPGSGSGDVAVHADLSNLAAGTTYHFRIVAANANGDANTTGISRGPDQSFSTLGPRVQGTTVSNTTTTSARLNAQVNPEGAATTFHFEYVADADYDSNAPNPYAAGHSTPESGSIGSDSSFHSVGVDLTDLAVGTTYHFRIVATNAGASQASSDGVFATFSEPPDFGGDNCSNDDLRSGASAALPDCRAFEQASPLDKNGADIAGDPLFNQAAADGHAALFSAIGDLPSSGGHGEGVTYVASRGASGWSYDSAQPVTAGGTSYGEERGRDENLGVVLSTGGVIGGEVGLFVTDLADFSREQIAATPAGSFEYDPQFADDTGHFIFESTGVLAPGAVAGKQNLYDYDHGDLVLAGRVPVFPATSCADGGSPAEECTGPAAGSFAGSYDLNNGSNLSNGYGYKQSTISDDGRRVFFTEGGTGRLYERLDGTQTIQLNADQGGVDPNPGRPAFFQGATPDGRTVYFTSCERLTPDSTAVSTAANTCSTVSQGQDLYSYDTQTDQLTDLSVDSNASDAHGAVVQGLLGASLDGSYVYFAANGVLASNTGADGTSATPGSCQISALAGSCNLYLAHSGQVSFVAHLSGSGISSNDFSNLQPARGLVADEKTARVAANGILLFQHSQRLYRFDPAADSGAGRLDCVSCDPSGAAEGAASLTGASGANFVALLNILPRNLSADGDRVIFQTKAKLVAGDVDGVTDVYEWEAEGSGSCHSHAQDGGCLYLLSAGTGTAESTLDDASASGDDVFIYTKDQLVPQDTDQLRDLYDVRVDGGLLSQHQGPAPSCGSAEQCHGEPTSAPEHQGAGTATFQGAGNPEIRRCPAGKVLRHGHCVRRHHHKKHRHHRPKKHRANADRGGSK